MRRGEVSFTKLQLLQNKNKIGENKTCDQLESNMHFARRIENC